MKVGKKIISFLLIMVLALGIMPMNSMAEPEAKTIDENVTFWLSFFPPEETGDELWDSFWIESEIGKDSAIESDTTISDMISNLTEKSGFESVEVTWYEEYDPDAENPDDNKPLDFGEDGLYAELGKTYTAVMLLEPKEGYVFDGGESKCPTVDFGNKDDMTDYKINYAVNGDGNLLIYIECHKIKEATIEGVSIFGVDSLSGHVGTSYEVDEKGSSALYNLFHFDHPTQSVDVKAISVWPHDLSGNELFGEGSTEPKVFQNNRIYRILFALDAKEGYVFPKKETPIDPKNPNVYEYTGDIYFNKTPYMKEVIVNTVGEKKVQTLYLGFEYTINNSSYIPRPGGSSSNNSNSNNTTTTTPTGPSIPVSGNGDASVSVSVSGNTATIGEITSAVVSAADGTSAADTNITIDISSQSGVNAATISMTSITRIANAINDPTNSVQALELNFAGGTAEFDAKAINSINSQASGKDVTITINQVSVSNLNTAQQSALNTLSVTSVISASVTSGGKSISNFNGGNQTISVNVNLGNRNGDFLHAFYVAADGTMTAQTTYYANGKVNFITGHNSDFVIVYDENMKNNQPINVYRAYNPNTGDHFLTTDKAEYNRVIKLGWDDEKVAFTAKVANGTKVYRLYNPYTGEHFYTKSAKEKNQNVKDGWNYEGSMFVSAGDKSVYRIYNPNQIANNHLFTTNKAEYDRLVRLGWNGEGVAFKAN